jgi:TolA-binding protein
MDAEISQSEQWLRVLAWLEDNWRRVAAVASVIIGVGIVVAFVIWQGAQKQRHASEALSLVLARPEAASSTALLGIAETHAGTQAAWRAQLLAAGALYREGRFQEAQAEFQKFLAEAPSGPLTSQARFGIAASREALGQVSEAISEYKSIVDNPASGVVIAQARFALGNLYVQQGQPELARAQYEELARVPGSSLAAEAQARLAELPPSTVSRQVEVPALAPSAVLTNQP